MELQQKYNGVFENITISDKKREEIEVAMRIAESSKVKIRLKKSVILVCMIMVVMSMGILAVASYKEYTAKDEKKVETRVVGVDTEGKVYVDGVEMDLRVEIDEEGSVYSFKEPPMSVENAGTMCLCEFYDDKGNLCILFCTGSDPRVDIAWSYDNYIENNENKWVRFEFLKIPVNAQLLTDVPCEEIDGVRTVHLTEIEPQTIPFSYNGETYTYVLNSLTYERIYKGIVEYDPTGEYKECIVYDYYQEFLDGLDYETETR